MSNPNPKNGKSTAPMTTATSTAVSSIAANSNNQVIITHNTPPPGNNAPKYGTLVPNRIFVGGIASNTTEAELLQLFAGYGTVKAAKIIQDRAGVSKGYGFVTFENEDDAKRALKDSDNISLRERKLNIAPAVKKQVLPRVFEASSPSTLPAGSPYNFMTPGTAVPYYQGGMAYFPQTASQGPGDPAAQQPTIYQTPQVYPTQTGHPQQPAFQSVVFPQPAMYMQAAPFIPMYDNYYYPNPSIPAAASGGQYMVGGQGGGQQAGGHMQPPPSTASPPRPPPGPCYATQQLGPPYGGPESVFYSTLPTMYAPSMEAGAPAIYTTECVDMSNGGYTEESSTLTMETHQDTGLHDTAVVVASSQVSDIEQRQTNTPVVSLTDRHQEKDFTSMQGGRRRKSSVTVQPTNHYNGYNNATYTSTIYNQSVPPYQHPVYSYNNTPQQMQMMPQPPIAQLADAQTQPYAHYPRHTLNGYHNNTQYNHHNGNNNLLANRRRKPINAVDRRVNEHPRRSSIRTNSNSSGCEGDDKSMPSTSTNTYINGYQKFGPNRSTFVNNSNYGNTKILTNRNNNTSGYNNNYSDRRVTVRNNSKSQSSSTSTTGQNNVSKVETNTVKAGSANNGNSSNKVNESSAEPVNTGGANSSAEPSGSLGNDNKDTNVELQQVHAAPAGGNPSFLPPRRTRRSVRRGTAGSALLNEIGAGDAPLPASQDLSDTCKKMEGLKL